MDMAKKRILSSHARVILRSSLWKLIWSGLKISIQKARLSKQINSRFNMAKVPKKLAIFWRMVLIEGEAKASIDIERTQWMIRHLKCVLS